MRDRCKPGEQMTTNESKTRKPRKSNKLLDDPIVDAGNRGLTKGEKEVWEVLEFVVQAKRRDIGLVGNAPSGMPGHVLNGFEKVKETVVFQWEMFDREIEETIDKETGQIRRTEILNYTDKPYLKIHSMMSQDERYMWELILKLQDPDWVAKLCKCPWCRKFLLNNTRWPNKYCSKECKKNDKNRDKGMRVYCHLQKKRIILPNCTSFQRTYKDNKRDDCVGCENYLEDPSKFRELVQRIKKRGRGKRRGNNNVTGN